MEALQEEMQPTPQKELQQAQQAQQAQQVQQMQQQQAEQLGSTQRQRKQRPVPTASGWPFSFPISHKREASQQVPDFGMASLRAASRRAACSRIPICLPTFAWLFGRAVLSLLLWYLQAPRTSCVRATRRYAWLPPRGFLQPH